MVSDLKQLCISSGQEQACESWYVPASEHIECSFTVRREYRFFGQSCHYLLSGRLAAYSGQSVVLRDCAIRGAYELN